VSQLSDLQLSSEQKLDELGGVDAISFISNGEIALFTGGSTFPNHFKEMFKTNLFITFTVLLLSTTFSLCSVSSNSKPVIGILSTPSDFHGQYSPEEFSYIKNSYAEFVESADATPIAIPWDMPEQDLILLLDSINGILFTGGDASMWEYDPKINDVRFSNFTQRAAFIFNYVIHLNDKGIHYPLYGICQGHEIIAMAFHQKPHIIDNYKHPGQLDTVEITFEGRQSRMFGNMPDHLVEFLKMERSMFYNHRYGFNTSLLMEQKAINDFFTITARGVDDNGKAFIAGLEAKDYPIYTVQYHPERVLSESMNKTQFKHPEEAVQAIIVQSMFFVSEAKKNNNKFRNEEAIEKFLLVNHEHVYMNTTWPKTFLYDKKSPITYHVNPDWSDGYILDEYECLDCGSNIEL
jgi:gamma-glutamyl hydrolase